MSCVSRLAVPVLKNPAAFHPKTGGKMHTKVLVVVFTSIALLGSVTSRNAWAQENDDNRRLQARPFVFVGSADECGGVAGSRIVTAAWLGGMGLPDNGELNTTVENLATSPSRNDPHRGLLLSKNGPTADCSSAGVTIRGLGRGMTLTELGFDYRNGTHCGAGAPRFNITSTEGFTYFAGCATGTKTPASQDPVEWTRVRFTTPAQVFPQLPVAPPFVFGPGGTQVSNISIVYDEGTDVPTTEDPRGAGLVVLDNIALNGDLIEQGTGVADGDNRRDGDDDDDDGDDRDDEERGRR
jgi:hypothetical protein